MIKRLIFSTVIIISLTLPAYSLDIQSDIIQKALNYIGSSYASGGTSPPKFDCSGFIGFLLKPFVPGLPRMSRDMANAGKKIRKEDLTPGDLVFFATTTVPGAVSHVALYIGQDSIIHAISDGPDSGVNITSLSSRYWRDHYHSSVRVLETAGQTAAAKVSGRTEKPIQFAKGIYNGDLVNGEPEGRGMLKLNNGDQYTGDFRKGKFNGNGTYRWVDGSVYSGEFEEDMIHGKGILKLADGTVNEGSFDRGKYVSKTSKAPAAQAAETYVQKKDSPWDTWTGYISGDFDAWRSQEQDEFEAWKKLNRVD